MFHFRAAIGCRSASGLRAPLHNLHCCLFVGARAWRGAGIACALLHYFFPSNCAHALFCASTLHSSIASLQPGCLYKQLLVCLAARARASCAYPCLHFHCIYCDVIVQGELGVVCAQLLLKGLSPWAWRGYLVAGAFVPVAPTHAYMFISCIVL